MTARAKEREAIWRRVVASRRWRDHRWLFVALAAAICIPLWFPLGWTVPVQPRVRAAYESVISVPVGGRILLVADYGPAAEPELRPFLETLKSLMRARQVGVVSLSLWPTAPPLVDRVFDQHDGGRYGVDFVNLGFKEGRTVVMQKVGESIPNTYSTDSRGVPLVRLPLMRGVDRLADFDLVVCVSGGVPGALEWIAQVQGRFVERMAAATTSSLAPDLLPFVASGQLTGLVDGLTGAAQFEVLATQPGAAHRGLEAQSFAHLVLVLVMLFACGAGLLRSGSGESRRVRS